ncbi:MAG: SHOCT domain-containing protein [Betaproteobacteria bacterium]|nr:SHOCT domain-containing protein [Betaproteobacteria bacterium]
MMWGLGGFDGGGMGIGMLLFWGLFIAVIVVSIRGFGDWSGKNDSRPQERKPIDILRERYARGEIGKDEFEERRRELSAR